MTASRWGTDVDDVRVGAASQARPWLSVIVLNAVNDPCSGISMWSTAGPRLSILDASVCASERGDHAAALVHIIEVVCGAFRWRERGSGYPVSCSVLVASASRSTFSTVNTEPRNR